MLEGFIPDASYGQFLQTQWHPGEARNATLFGLPAGTKVDRHRMRPVTTYMCPACGLLRSYAQADPKAPTHT